MATILSYFQRPKQDFLSVPSPVEGFCHGFGRPVSYQPPVAATEEGGGGVVHVAVGKSVEKAVALLEWSFRMFQGQEICILHVHRPSPLIPTLLGKLPANQANPKTVSAFRNEERQETIRLLSIYLTACSKSRVKASVITIEADEIKEGIIELVNVHGVKTLAIGAVPMSGMKGIKKSRKASYAAKHAPYCEMWFVSKGKLIYTRHASESTSPLLPSSQLTTTSPLSLRSESLDSNRNEQAVVVCPGLTMSSISPCFDNPCSTLLQVYASSSTSSSSFSSCPRSNESTSSVPITKSVEECNEWKDNAHFELTQEENLIVEATESINKRMVVLDNRVQETKHRPGELITTQASVATIQQKRQKLQRPNGKSMGWFAECGDAERYYHANEGIRYGDTSQLPEFSLLDLETATCNFSESFLIGQGNYGTVYKGELFNKTVAIKKLHSYNNPKLTELHKLLQIFEKQQNPYLVDLMGVCSEPLLLVYEYLPGGSLQNHLFNNCGNRPLNWKTRARIVADIAKGLSFLHSVEPEKIVHGNLKPENIHLDMEYRCRISDFGDHMLMKTVALRCPSFRHCTGSSCTVSYTDPECHRTGILTHKSDIYSFGLIILQLVTGRTLGGLTFLVRKAVCDGKVASIMDLSGGDWSMYVVRRLVELGLQCCGLNSEDRPDLTPLLVKELDHLHRIEERSAPTFFLCPIHQEIMLDPQVAADGFTYEGEAMRGWLRKGHDTSPMTNLKLNHLNLTPNHSLRLAIQDWLHKS